MKKIFKIIKYGCLGYFILTSVIGIALHYGIIYGIIFTISIILLVYFIKKSKPKPTTDLPKNKENSEKTESPAFHKGFSEDDFLVNKTRKIDKKYLYPRKDLEDTSHYFYGKKIVITGRFEKIHFRNKIAKELWNVGADIDTNIGKNTNIVIVGSYDVGPKKMEQIIEKGLKIIREDELLEKLPAILQR